jgi:Tfp pilus assembly protein PilF
MNNFLTSAKRLVTLMVILYHHPKGEALAYNCMGVAYQKLGQKNPDYYRFALDNHMKHSQIGDIAGKFIASVNIGMVYSALGETEKAASYHQTALKYAIQMSSVAGQTIAVGNIGSIGVS